MTRFPASLDRICQQMFPSIVPLVKTSVSEISSGMTPHRLVVSNWVYDTAAGPSARNLKPASSRLEPAPS